jgi:hypothetical protein
MLHYRGERVAFVEKPDLTYGIVLSTMMAMRDGITMVYAGTYYQTGHQIYGVSLRTGYSLAGCRFRALKGAFPIACQ